VKLKILPYKIGSQSAKMLARALGVKRIIPGGGYVPRSSTTIINWGSSNLGFHYSGRVLNRPEAVAKAANKLSTLSVLAANGISVPEYTTDRMVARRWLEDDYRVVVRHKLSSHSGQGIEIVRPDEYRELPHAPLYTKYVRKDQEFRVHVFNGVVIDYSEKRKRAGSSVTSNLVRNHANGWVFCRDGVVCPDFVKTSCVKSVKALGLDFGAVDIVVRDGKCWVLEVNSAPGIEGSTLRKYVEALRYYVPDRRYDERF
jgi:glutathione synthase/RimK-type ligase-like ATP-grasp enzyme